jgi:hypothetical protein
MISLQSRISIPSDVLFHEVDGQAVILNLESGQYYGLDETGSRMWALLAEHGQLELVYQNLLEEYNVEPEQLQGDLLKLMDELASQGLVKVDET